MKPFETYISIASRMYIIQNKRICSGCQKFQANNNFIAFLIDSNKWR